MTNDNQTEWTEIFDYRCFEPKKREDRMMLGPDSRARQCVFCFKSEPDVKFKKEAHVIPAAFGNRTLFSREECDTCNERAGALFEGDLANSLALARAVTGTRSRKGSVKIKLRPHLDPASYIEGKPGTKGAPGETYIVTTDDDDSVQTTLNEEKGELEIRAKVPHYTPANIAKAMARMLYFVASIEDRANLQHVLQWIRGEVSWEPLAYFNLFFAGPQDPEFRLQVWRGCGAPFAVQFGNGSFSNILVIPDPSWVLPDSVIFPGLESEVNIPPLIHLVVAPTEDANITKCRRDELVVPVWKEKQTD